MKTKNSLTALQPPPRQKAGGGCLECRVSVLARKLWAIAHKAACKVQPDRFWGWQTWEMENDIPGRKAAWEALARHWLKRANNKVRGGHNH